MPVSSIIQFRRPIYLSAHTRLQKIPTSQPLCQTKITQHHAASCIIEVQAVDKEILCLDVPVQDAVLVHMRNGSKPLAHDAAKRLVAKTGSPLNPPQCSLQVSHIPVHDNVMIVVACEIVEQLRQIFARLANLENLNLVSEGILRPAWNELCC